MRNLLIASAVCGLTVTIIPPFLCFGGTIDLPMSQQLMTLGMILWFAGEVLRVIRGRNRQ
jgi:hypothetical protein